MGNALFRASLRGFNRQDVTDYIAKLNREFEELKNESEVKSAELGDRLAVKDEELSDLSASLGAAQGDLSALRAELARVRGELDQSKKEGVQTVSRLENEAAEKEELALKVTQYELVVSELKGRLKELEMTREEIADILIEAKNAATRIIDEAELYADEVRERVAGEIRGINDSISLSRASIGRSGDEILLEIEKIREAVVGMDRAMAEFDGGGRKASACEFADLDTPKPNKAVIPDESESGDAPPCGYGFRLR